MTSDLSELIMSLCVGLGLSAACGFRVFVPMLVMSIAAHSGHLSLSPGFQWIGSTAAVAAFSLATILEVTGYFVPWVDHALDTVATPSAVVAGAVVTASMVTDMSPFLKWSLALIAGGGVAAAVQGATVVARTVSTAATGGLANPAVAAMELGGSVLTSVLAVVAPVLALLLVGVVVAGVGYKIARNRAGSASGPLPKAAN